MSAHASPAESRISVRDIRLRKGQDPLVCLTAYTAPMARLMDPFCDILLVGDSVGMVVHGLPSTVGVTLDMMILHGQAVMRGSRRALVVVDMPFGSCEGAPEVAFANAVRVLQETGAQAVKIESAPAVIANIRYLVERGVPVMGHVGLRPQAVCFETLGVPNCGHRYGHRGQTRYRGPSKGPVRHHGFSQSFCYQGFGSAAQVC